MAEYIDRKQINLFGFFDAGDYSQAMRCINNMPTANVVEREKVDKAIEEIMEYVKYCDENLQAPLISRAIYILKRNIGE